MMAQAQELLSADEGVDPPKLRHKRDALAAKPELLGRLDEEIANAVHEDELEEEIGGADAVKERIELAIIDLDEAIICRTATGTRVGVAETYEIDGARVGAQSHDGITDPPRDSGTRTANPPADTHAESLHRDRRAPRHTSEDPPPLGGGETDSRGRGETPLTDVTKEDPSVRSSHVKLPKLSLKKFNGDLTQWTTFWDTFEAAVHQNPALTSIDKFSYLTSLLESTAAEAIAGLKLTSVNYDEAVATLYRRFGNKQCIINRHMELLLRLEAVTSTHDLKGLRQLFDTVESNVRGLRALGVAASSYGGLMSSILMGRLPSELRLIVSRELREDEWDLETMMGVLQREVEARERSVGAASSQTRKGTTTNPPPTALSLTTGSLTPITCAYCGQPHRSNACQTIKSPEERKRALRTSGRCYICLRRNHISRNCRSPARCNKCNGRHHSSLCSMSSNASAPTLVAQTPVSGSQPPALTGTPRASTTSSMCAVSRTRILLQTAKAVVSDATRPDPVPTVEARAVLDTGSQRSYVTRRIQTALQAQKSHSELMIIKTFGSGRGEETLCDVVHLKLAMNNGEQLVLSMVVVPHICDPVRAQPIDTSKATYGHLSGLTLADSSNAMDDLDIDILVGSDHYWKLVTGRVVKGDGGPTAIETRLGWVLSGPADGVQEETSINLIPAHSTHILRVDNFSEAENLDSQLRRFWELESLGILKDEQPLEQQFTQQITFKRGRYEVHLPWKDSHPHLPDHYGLCQRRLQGLLRRLRQNPKQLKQYDSVIQEQLRLGIVEAVPEPSICNGNRVHYLPHHGVFRHDKLTTKLRVVYDASAKTDGPSLNDCLYTGPNFGQNILDILLRFRTHPIALVGDVEKAFLMVSVTARDRDALRFLWVANIRHPDPEIVVLRFTRVVFGVSASPFLLNATIHHHMEKLKSEQPCFVEKFHRSIYVDDIAVGAEDIDSAYNFYLMAKLHLATASFNLRKFESNSMELRQRIQENEQAPHNCEGSSATQSLPSGRDRQLQVLGVCWDVKSDELVFDIADVARLMKETSPTKRNAVSLATRFYDPLGVMSPITIRFKQLFQRLCELKVDWDDPLMGDSLGEWEVLTADLQEFSSIRVPRCCTSCPGDQSARSHSLQGYCDASLRAYAAVVYLRTEWDNGVIDRLLCAKTRVAPVKGFTIPRLELLSALLLARLVSTVQAALESEMEFSSVSCHTDSQVALFWIIGRGREWKQFVQNRVMEIRRLIPVSSWKHCPGTQNPADIPSRGVSPTELQGKLELWRHGPSWTAPTDTDTAVELMEPPKECIDEMRIRDRDKPTLNLLNTYSAEAVLVLGNYSSLRRLLRVTAYVLKFVNAARRKDVAGASQSGCTLTAEGVQRAMVYWLKNSQLPMPVMKEFQQWQKQFGLFQDDHGLWRCGGRLSNAEIAPETKHPILLNRNHHLTTLIIRDCHERVMHGGVKSTLTELRSKYWIVRGRNLIGRIVSSCIVCRRFQGRPYTAPPAPPLPSFRVTEARPFSYTGVDFAGPLYVRDTLSSVAQKVWICLYTCCVTRAVHLDLVSDMTAEAFIRCFKRFTARRGFPVRVVSDNAKTFKAAARMVKTIVETSQVTRYLSNVGVRWTFNVERAPWWGGVFERMIQTAKRCLRKTIGRARLTHEELLTSVVEVEMTLNSRPLSFVSSEDTEEPLTPSHLLCGYRILSLPDPVIGVDEEDFDRPASATDFTRRMKHLSKVLADFWRRWRTEYLLELREAHRHHHTSDVTDGPITVGDIVIIHDENLPRGLWKLGRVEKLMVGTDGKVRCAEVRVSASGRSSTTMKQPLQRLYPIETGNQGQTGLMQEGNPIEGDSASLHGGDVCSVESPPVRERRPRRQAFVRAQDTIRTWCNDLRPEGTDQ